MLHSARLLLRRESPPQSSPVVDSVAEPAISSICGPVVAAVSREAGGGECERSLEWCGWLAPSLLLAGEALRLLEGRGEQGPRAVLAQCLRTTELMQQAMKRLGVDRSE